MKKFVFVAALLVFVCGISWASDCPSPKPLSCERLRQLEKIRCPQDPNYDHGCPECNTHCPEPTVLHSECVPCAACAECPKPETVTKIAYMDPLPVKSHGKGVLGAGPVYFHGLGAQLVGGYKAPDNAKGQSWQIIGGPFWVPQNGIPQYDGVATRGCTKIPYSVPAYDDKGAWGASVLALWLF